MLAGLALLALASPAHAAPAGSTFLVSRPDGSGPFALPLDNNSGAPMGVSADGRYVAFTSPADGFAAGVDPRVKNVFLRDAATGTTTLVSRSDGVNGAGVNADVATLDGARIGLTVEPGTQVPDAPHNVPHVLVAFSTTATNLVDHTDHAIPATGGRQEVWLRDVTAGTTYLVSRASGLTGAVADGQSSEPSLAAGPHGAIVAFTSASTNLNPLGPFVGTNGRNVYLREVTEGATHLVSCAFQSCTGGRTPEGISWQPSVQYVEGSNATAMCGVGQQCAMVAFTTSDPSMAGAPITDATTQIVVGRALETNGQQLANFDLWANASVRYATSELGNSNSERPSLSPDGQLVAFLSRATNLDPFEAPPPGATPPWTSEAYLHFLTPIVGGSTFLKSQGASGPADAPVSDVSLGGPFAHRRIAFSTTAGNLGVPNPFGVPRAYQIAETSGISTLLDRGSGAAGAIGDRASSTPMVSGDGSAVVFSSNSTNLGAGGGTEFTRVYRRRIDPAAPDFESLQLISRPASGTDGSQSADLTHDAISADGRYVAFQSQADDLSSVDDNRLMNVFVRDTVSETTTLVSRASGASGAAANDTSTLSGISDDGRRVLFTSGGTNLGAPADGPHAYVRDLAANTTTVVTRVNGPSGVIAPGIGLAISGDGNRVAFHAESGFEPSAVDGAGHLYVRDLAAQTTTFVDRDSGPNGFAAGDDPAEAALNRDGSRVVWSTRADLPLAGGEPTRVQRVYMRDLSANTTVLLSRTEGLKGPQANADSFAPAIDAAGDVVAFESDATNLGAPSAPRSIWVRHVATGHNELVSRANGATGAPANALSFRPSIDAAGDRVAFVTAASNLGAGPAVHGSETYVRDLSAKTTEVVSRVNGVGGAPADPAGFGGVSLSASGGCVAFAGTGLNYGDGLASADFTGVRERTLRDNCAPAAKSAPTSEPGVVSRVATRPTRFYVGGPGGGTRITFMLDKPSTVALSFDRLVRGPHAATSAIHREHKRVMQRVGRLTVRGHAGLNSVRFSGRLHHRALAPGRYRLTVTPSHGRGDSAWFVVVKAPKPRHRHAR